MPYSATISRGALSEIVLTDRYLDPSKILSSIHFVMYSFILVFLTSIRINRLILHIDTTAGRRRDILQPLYINIFEYTDSLIYREAVSKE